MLCILTAKQLNVLMHSLFCKNCLCEGLQVRLLHVFLKHYIQLDPDIRELFSTYKETTYRTMQHGDCYKIPLLNYCCNDVIEMLHKKVILIKKHVK